MFKKRSKENKADIKARIEMLENDIRSLDRIIKKHRVDILQAEYNIAKTSLELEILYEKLTNKDIK